MNLSRYPLFLVLMFQTGMAMFVPAAHALALQSFAEARSFFYAGLLLILFTAFVGIAVRKEAQEGISQRDQLLILLGAFVILPIFMAVPFQEASNGMSYFKAYFEMVSSFTTTGATLFTNVYDYSPTMHLWRAEVAWFGGYIMLVAAVAILAPMHLGGYEVIGAATDTYATDRLAGSAVREGAVGRIGRWSQKIFPIYLGVTGLLWIGLIFTGQGITEALIHAMSVLSTSGISGTGGFDSSGLNFGAELLVCVFALAGLSRLTLLPDKGRGDKLLHDREIRMGLIIVFAVPTALMLRHWLAAISYGDTETLSTLLRAFWGGLFTSLSFMTTTGFVSAEWHEIALWSGLGAPGMLLVGLAVIGGGVATTAGGVKLLRIYALFGQGTREMGRLVHPSSVGQSGQKSLRISQDGTRIAWVFFMLYAVSIAVVMVLLGLFNIPFEDAAVLAVAALSNTGPLIQVGAESVLTYGVLDEGAKAVLIATMIVGRLEALALIALFNRDFWRR